MISTGLLSSFRESGKDYLYITEAGLWSKPTWESSGDNGLLAGYRIAPSSEQYWDMSIADNRNKLKAEIIRIGYNQVVQVVWKLQLGSVSEFGGRQSSDRIQWYTWKDGKLVEPENQSHISWVE